MPQPEIQAAVLDMADFSILVAPLVVWLASWLVCFAEVKKTAITDACRGEIY
jgi:hypothetical protein